MDYDHSYITNLDLYKENSHGNKNGPNLQNLGPQHLFNTVAPSDVHHFYVKYLFILESKVQQSQILIFQNFNN
jgi:hypothetical protein